jgi:hypothetical protein
LFFVFAGTAGWAGVTGVKVGVGYVTNDRDLEDFAVAARCASLAILCLLLAAATALKQLPARPGQASVWWRWAFVVALGVLSISWIVPPLLITSQRELLLQDPGYWTQSAVVLVCCALVVAVSLRRGVSSPRRMPTQFRFPKQAEDCDV